MADNNGPHDAGDIVDRLRTFASEWHRCSSGPMGWLKFPEHYNEAADEIARLRARVGVLDGVVAAARATSQSMIDGYKAGGVDTYGPHAEGLCDGGCRVIDAMAAAEAARKAEKGGAM